MNEENQEKRPDSEKKEIKIVINGREVDVYEKKLTFEQVVKLSLNEYTPAENVVYSVTFSKGRQPDKGVMVPGDEVTIKKGMVFNVTKTTRS